ncbi:MAG: DUF58 domain-containing protein [Frankiaceae bacterium]|nr:DUF58 domain-containing protein [Frankiaceae bacterium]
MTGRALALLLGSLALVGAGLLLRWPEMSALGGAGATLVVVLVVAGLRRVQVTLSIERRDMRVVRGRPASVRLKVDVPRRRAGLRLVEGDINRPLSSVRLPKRRADGWTAVAAPIDTSRRGHWVAGPYTVVQGDAWGVVRRVVGRADAGTVTVHPRTHRVRRSVLASNLAGESESASRRMGDEHFFALREYVLGDEPRTVHWRSSARAGRLMVRQQVAAATTGTTIVLDTDLTAYRSDGQYGVAADVERFEVAVEVAASVACAQAAAEQVHLVVATGGSSVTSAAPGATGALLDVLAVVQPVAPVSASPQELPGIVRRTRCARVVLVSGSPGQKTLNSLSALAKIVPATVLIRVAAREPAAGLPGRVVDVERAEDLA